MGRIVVFIISFAVWGILTWIPDAQELAVGAAMSLVITLAFGDVFTVKFKKLFQIKRYFYFVYYAFVFTYYCILANIDVALRILNPRLPINPGIVKIKTNLKNEVAQTMLANSITLTPGTMTVDIKKGFMYVHWINVKAKDVKKATEIISQRFEKLIKEIFE
ncbi:Na+/H+ antiporter subunit E [Candidatus Margulisiibacteriota bacterium]